jgi:hypothetical protein
MGPYLKCCAQVPSYGLTAMRRFPPTGEEHQTVPEKRRRAIPMLAPLGAARILGLAEGREASVAKRRFYFAR